LCGCYCTSSAESANPLNTFIKIAKQENFKQNSRSFILWQNSGETASFIFFYCCVRWGLSIDNKRTRSLSFNAKATSPFQELTYILQRLVIKWQHFHNHEDLKQQIWKLTETHILLCSHFFKCNVCLHVDTKGKPREK
jgi:hypothetical protein